MGLEREEGYAKQWKQAPAVADAAGATIPANTEKEEECQYASVSQRYSPVVSPPLMSEKRKGQARISACFSK